jgi:hypothetical protein
MFYLRENAHRILSNINMDVFVLIQHFMILKIIYVQKHVNKAIMEFLVYVLNVLKDVKIV